MEININKTLVIISCQFYGFVLLRLVKDTAHKDDDGDEDEAELQSSVSSL